MNTSAIKTKLGNAIICIEGSEELYREIEREISFSKELNCDEIDIVYRFPEKIKANMRPDNFDVKFKNIFFDVYICNDRPTIVTIFIKTPLPFKLLRVLPENMQRTCSVLLFKNLFTFDEYLSAKLLYDVFLCTTQHVIMEKGQSYMHASAVADSNNCVYIFAGPSHCGKTSILNFMLMENDSFRALSDDMLIIDNQGKAYLNDINMNINPFALLFREPLETRFFENINYTEKILFKLFSFFGKYIIKRFPIAKIYDDHQLAREGNIRYYFYIHRTNTQDFRIQKIKPADFAWRTSHDLVKEIKNLSKCNNTKDIQGEIADIHRHAIGEAECYKMIIPASKSPIEIKELTQEFF